MKNRSSKIAIGILLIIAFFLLYRSRVMLPTSIPNDILISSAAPDECQNPKYHRLIWDSDPSRNAVIGFSLNDESNCTYYVKYGSDTNESEWSKQSISNSSIFDNSLKSYFVRLKDLSPNSAIYYTVCGKDKENTEVCGERFWFKTAPGDNNRSPFIIIAGGDTRTNWEKRIQGNKLVAKIRPLFVMHGGDYTGYNNAAEIKKFLEDWTFTFSIDSINKPNDYKRIYPLLPTLGNHEDTINWPGEDNFSTLFEVFGIDFNQNGECSARDTYGAFNISPLMRVYTLNSELKRSGWSTAASEMNLWLQNDLNTSWSAAPGQWRFAQYHIPMFPHASDRNQNLILYDWWAKYFYDYGMNLVIESDSHLSKLTKAIHPGSIDFSDDFSSDTLKEYVVDNSEKIVWDSKTERIQISTGADQNTSFSFSALREKEKYSFSIDFHPYMKYKSGSKMIVKLMQDEQTYYKIENSDGLDGGKISKYINGVEVDYASFTKKYRQKKNYTISIDFSPDKTVVHAFQEKLEMIKDTNSIKVNSFAVETYQQDAYFDNIYYYKGFDENKSGGTVYVGEGGWGATLRPADDKKSWTIDAAKIYQFKVISVSKDNLVVRTAQFDGNVSALTHIERRNYPLILPKNINWWSADTIGEALILKKSIEGGRSIIDTSHASILKVIHSESTNTLKQF